FAEEGALFSGDSLFAGSIGRTDFPHGSMSKLVRSVKETLLSLPDETKVFPGHEESTTIGDEKAYNMFLA
ncbi:MAG: MBL fold metallo-hydrolase, partial [Lachnospiraceae bacterium]|nr:MBL fold metallo-hydrolase [Lachnospiraceae bacterium]